MSEMVWCGKKLKIHHGIIVVVLAALEIFVVSGFLGRWFGFYGTLVNELVLLAIAVSAVLGFRGNLRAVFPLAMPEVCQTFGTLVLWLGSFFVSIVVSLFVTSLFPEEAIRVSEGLSGLMLSVPFGIALFIVAVSPAVCEEAVFRGVFFNSLWEPRRNKWIPVLVTAVVFGAFHGSIVRFFPTCILGIAMGYLLMETGNMFYNILFHAANNAFSLSVTYLLQFADQGEIDALVQESSELIDIPLIVYVFEAVIFGVSGIALLWLGRFLIRQGRAK